MYFRPCSSQPTPPFNTMKNFHYPALIALVGLLTVVSGCGNQTDQVSPLAEHMNRGWQTHWRGNMVAELRQQLVGEQQMDDRVLQQPYQSCFPGRLVDYYVELDIQRDSLERELLVYQAGSEIIYATRTEADFHVEHVGVLVIDSLLSQAQRIAADSAEVLRDKTLAKMHNEYTRAQSRPDLHDQSCTKSDFDQHWYCIESYLLTAPAR